MPTPLDYGASVPINQRAPFSVNVDPSLPPGDRKFKDYIPRATSVVVNTKPDDTIRRKNFVKPPVARYEQDYIAPADAEAKRRNERNSITEIAKQLYEAEANRRVAYASAEKKIASAKNGDESEELVKARKIVANAKPMTKEEAMEKAARQFYGITS